MTCHPQISNQIIARRRGLLAERPVSPKQPGDAMLHDLQDDVERVTRIAAVPTILEVVCRTTGMRFAAIARVTEDKWVACAVLDQIDFGLKRGGELKIGTTICHDIQQSREAVVIDNISDNLEWCEHVAPATYGFQSYISVPIILADGSFFGTLCAIDPRPARLQASETIGMFRLFAELIASHLNADRQLAAREADLREERLTAELREQFIAVLGHDLRNPLSAMLSGLSLLSRNPTEEKSASIMHMMQDSGHRMSGLINNVMDFARGRLGGGFPVERNAKEPLEPVLREVIAETNASAPDRIINTEFSMPYPVNCDRGRIAQLFSNLLGNAITYGPPADPVHVRAMSSEDHFELSVANTGDPIPPVALERLFLPFYRGAVRASAQGLGLGLYIAHEIARAHGGTLGVTSTEAETCFTLRMPI
jgi:signal transduction histidine kinase